MISSETSATRTLAENEQQFRIVKIPSCSTSYLQPMLLLRTQAKRTNKVRVSELSILLFSKLAIISSKPFLSIKAQHMSGSLRFKIYSITFRAYRRQANALSRTTKQKPSKQDSAIDFTTDSDVRPQQSELAMKDSNFLRRYSGNNSSLSLLFSQSKNYGPNGRWLQKPVSMEQMQEKQGSQSIVSLLSCSKQQAIAFSEGEQTLVVIASDMNLIYVMFSKPNSYI